MKLRPIALLFSLLLACAIPASYAVAQSTDEKKKIENTPAQDVRKFSVKLFEIRHRNPDSLANALYALGSGAPGSTMQPNSTLGTLTVRDYPENIAAIEESLKRLDVPNKSPVSLEFQLHLIAASMKESEKPREVPKNLEPVLEQLKSTLKFTNYNYVSSALSRVSDRGTIESNGVTGSLYPYMSNQASYQYVLSKATLTQDTAGKESIQIDAFRFSISYLVGPPGGQQQRNVGITTPLSLREGEIAVVGTANISGSDEAIIVAISVKKAK